MTGANEVPEPVTLRGLHRLDDDVVVPPVGTDLVNVVAVRILHGTIEPHVEEQGAVARPLIGPDPQELPVDGEAHLGRQVLRDGAEREGVGLDCRVHGGRSRLAAEVADHLVGGGWHAVLLGASSAVRRAAVSSLFSCTGGRRDPEIQSTGSTLPRSSVTERTCMGLTDCQAAVTAGAATEPTATR